MVQWLHLLTDAHGWNSRGRGQFCQNPWQEVHASLKKSQYFVFYKKTFIAIFKKFAGGSYVIHPYSTPCVHLGIYLTIEDLGKKISLTKDISLLLQSQILSLKLELELKFSFEIQQKRWISWSTLFPRLTIRLWVTKNRKKNRSPKYRLIE